MFIDTHCHLNFKDFREDADEVIKRTLKENVQFIIVGSQYSTSQRAVAYADKYNKNEKRGVWAAVGIHPVHLFNSVGDDDEEFPKKVSLEKFDYNKYLELAKNDKVVAIGEVGLDYHHFETTNLQINKAQQEVSEIIELQKKVFKEFIRLANEVGKPLIIHGWNADKKDRKLVGGAIAYEDILGIVHGSQFTVHEDDENNEMDDSEGVKAVDVKGGSNFLTKNLLSVNCDVIAKKRGVVHSFIGNYKMAKRFIEEGFLIGLNGIATYSESYDRLIKEIGLENIIIETDAPYLTPNPLERYSRNEPLNVKLVAQKIAEVLNVEVAEVEKVTTQNAKKLFGI
jgi:TatD DNase family protein